jgi:DNA-binding response OmpR family regulator
MPRILLVDDDPALLDVVAMAFEDAGFAVETAGDGILAMAAVNRQRPDLVVTDVNMPRLDGLGLCRRLRRAWPQLPVILLTSRDAELDEAMALEDGADDYITKPFSTRVLLARAGALLRRGAGGVSTAGSGPRHLGPLRIDLDRVEVRFYDQPVVVTMGELRLLDVLTRRPGMVLSRDALLAQMRDDGSVVEARIIDTYVRRIRRKLEAISAEADPIETVIGAGYRWRHP